MQVKSINQIKFISTPNFRAQVPHLPTIETGEAQTISMKGSEALANYNTLLINPKKSLDLEPNELIFTSDMNIEGEKVYSSEGKLKAIVKEDDDSKTIYYVDNEEVINTADVFDKKSNSIVASQYVNDNYANITKYNNGKVISSSCYEDGKPVASVKYEYKDNGITKYMSHNFIDDTYYIDLEDEKTNSYKSISLDENAKFVEISEHKENKTRSRDVEAKFYNGGIYSLRKSESIIMPSLLGHDKLADPNLSPAKDVEVSELIKLPDSQKYFYSNGSIEKCIDGNKTINFDLSGKVTSIFETLENGDEKTTEFNKYTDLKDVTIISDGNKYKEINYDKQNKPNSYYEGIKQDDGIKYNLSLYFNKQGILENAYNN